MEHSSFKPHKIAHTVLDLIGNTPMVRLNRLVEPGMAAVYGKLESMNPGGSVKDRICLNIIRMAEQQGLIDADSTIIEPTSGNTGIGLAMVCAVKGYKCIITMSENQSLERIYILRAYGAEVILTPASKGMVGAIERAEQIAKTTKKSFVPHQFKNRANPDMHRRTTALEILDATGGRIDAFVAGIGTGGTITGVGEVLKERDSSVYCVGVEPAASAVLSGKKPGFHRIQGIGAGFVPDVLNRSVIDELITVTDMQANAMTKRLSREEGLLLGISSGANVHAALHIARRLGEGKVVVVILCDTGERYFSMEQYFEA